MEYFRSFTMAEGLKEKPSFLAAAMKEDNSVKAEVSSEMSMRHDLTKETVAQCR
jgi:hypothetical protein